MILELTEKEASVLIGMINVCIQVKGLEVAESGVVLVKKIRDAAEKAAEVAEEKK